MVVIGVYLLNLFSVQDYGMNGIGLIVITAVAISVFANYLIETHQITNPLFFILPGLAASIFSVMAVRELSIITIVGVLFLVPGLVMFIRKSISHETKKQ